VDGVAGEALTPIVVVALAARQVELALPLREELSAVFDEWGEARVGWRGDRFAT
jgi:hypothetical protein